MRFRCNLCREKTWPQDFVFEDHGGVCPQCGVSGSPAIAQLVDVHLIALDPKGPIQGKYGRQKIACQPRRSHLATHSGDFFSATDQPGVVTCPRCKSTPEYLEVCAIWGIAPDPVLSAKLVVDLGKKSD